ncbi:MAG: TRAP transporter large permease subunit [Candidatus Bathyarchaeia archaeon]
MDLLILSILLFGSLICFLIIGVPVAFALAGSAIFFAIYHAGIGGLVAIISNVKGVMDNFLLTAIPFFIFMGIVLQKSGVIEEAFDAINKWVGWIRGGLAVCVILVCTVFAACTGVAGASVVTMAIVALPEMLRRRYSTTISLGCIAAGGALGVIIPPSVLMIVYGVYTGESIGQLYAGGLFPGLLLSTSYICFLLLVGLFKASSLPRTVVGEVTYKERILAIKKILIPLLIILLVLGTVFLGVCTPTEAAALGASGSLVFALFSRRLTWSLLKESALSTLVYSCMVTWLIIGGACFSYVCMLAGIPEAIQNVVASLQMSKYMVLAIIQVVLFVLGCLMDPGAIIMVTCPIFVPLVRALGFDTLWYAILFMVNMQMAYLTPPFGFTLFYLKSVLPDIPIHIIYRGVMPFVCLQAIVLICVIIFPEIALWLPRRLFG